MRDGDPLKLTGIPARKAHENDAIPRIAPKWLKHDKQVRKFFHLPDYIFNDLIIGAALQGLFPGARCRERQ
jgi:hypothetical protein